MYDHFDLKLRTIKDQNDIFVTLRTKIASEWYFKN